MTPLNIATLEMVRDSIEALYTERGSSRAFTTREQGRYDLLVALELRMMAGASL